MRRGFSLIGVIILVLVISAGSQAWAGGRYHGHNSAVWWGVGVGAALGTLGILAARPYGPVVQPYPAYPVWSKYLKPIRRHRL
jgi:hypothetical protein